MLNFNISKDPPLVADKPPPAMYEIEFSRFEGAFSDSLPCPVLPARGDPFFSNVTKKLTAMNGWVLTRI